jgi:hypothetical protein
MKTFTPDLDPAVLERLREYAGQFAPDFPQSKPARWTEAGIHEEAVTRALRYRRTNAAGAKSRPLARHSAFAFFSAPLSRG